MLNVHKRVEQGKSERRASSNVSERGDRILAAAISLFVRDGVAAFTARGVAKEAGVSLGSVQYIFPTKDLLLAAMLERVLADYDEMYGRIAASLPFNGEERLLGVIEFLVADIWRADSRKFFFNFYALSCHNSFAASLLIDTFSHHRRRIAAYIGAARPNFSEEECFNVALQISALIEGLMIYTAPGSKSVTKREHLTQLVKQTLLRLIDPAMSARLALSPLSRK